MNKVIEDMSKTSTQSIPFRKKNISGYEIEFTAEIKETKSLGVMLRHKKTGLRVARFYSDDKEYFFSFNFDTKPDNNKGTAHIVEHSVLSGSKNFNIPDPFSICASLSALSYINAETHKNFTAYPVASTVLRDLTCAFRMYADAVFNPIISKATFQKEGIRYITNSNGEVCDFSGIVFNEMQDGYNTRSDRAFSGFKALLSKTCERYESGGDINSIPFLTYNEFVQFYKKNYTPENCILVLYGKKDCDKLLEILDAEVLGNRESDNNNSEVKNSIDFPDIISNKNNAILKNSSSGDKYMLVPFSIEDVDRSSFYLIFDTGLSMVDSISYRMTSILINAILGSYQSPLYKALIDLGISKDISDDSGMDVCDDKIYITIALDDILINGKEDEIVAECSQKILQAISNLKLDEHFFDEVANSIKTIKVELMDRGSTPRGKILSERIMKNPNRDFGLCDCLSNICEIEENFKKDKNIFTKFYEKVFVKSLVSKMFVVPSDDFDSEQEQNKIKILNYINSNKNKFIDEDSESLVRELQSEDKENSGEIDVKKYFQFEPMRKIISYAEYKDNFVNYFSDGKLTAQNQKNISYKDVKLQNKSHNRTIISFTKGDREDISFYRLAFDLSSLSLDEMYLLQIMSESMKRADVKGYDKFFTKFFSIFHSFDMYVNTFASIDKSFQNDNPLYYIIRFKLLSEDIDEGMHLLAKLLSDCVFTDENISNSISGLQSEYSDVVYYACGYSQILTLSDFAVGKLVDNITRGMLFKEFIDSVNTKDKKSISNIKESVIALYNKIFVRNNLIMSLYAKEQNYDKISSFVNLLPLSVSKLGINNVMNLSNADFNSNSRLAGLLSKKTNIKISELNGFPLYFYKIPGNVSYPCISLQSPVRSSGLDILTYYFQDKSLYKSIRVEGGAYGVYFDYNYYEGYSAVYSIRDPNGKNSFEKFLKSLYVKLNKNIFMDARRSLFVPITHPQSNEKKSYAYLRRFLQDITNDERKQRIERAYNLTLKECKNELEQFIEEYVQNGKKSYSILSNNIN